ncbi:MAG: hypothetical protein KatS3mg130_2032 [Candidatus Sumerlaea sp.]|mgnify:FL=1|nr:MAG: hypothetical protein KatS3mg130_2032 [Candidatus Sumerlaea sp.]
MLRVFANNTQDTLALNQLALFANWLDGRSYLHFLVTVCGKICVRDEATAMVLARNVLLETVGNSTARQIVRRKLHTNLVSGKYANKVHSHLSRDVC